MHQDQITPTPIDGLSALFTHNGLSDAERKQLRRLTAHLLQSHVHARQPQSDGELVAFLSGRWEAALEDLDSDMDLASEAFLVHAEDAAWVLGRDVSDVRAGIARLAGEGAVSAVATAEGALVSFAPTVEAASPALERQVYRDYISRHGRLLHGLAAFYLKAIGDDLSEFETSEKGSTAVDLRQRYDDVAETDGPDVLLDRWSSAPERTYHWLDRLAGIELEVAVLSGLPTVGLRHDLQRFDTDRVLILSRALDPSL